MLRGLLTATCILIGTNAVSAAPILKDPVKGMPHLVIQIKAIDEWFADYDQLREHLKDLPEREKLPNSDQIKNSLSGLFANWKEAIDLSRPLGVYVTFSAELEKTRPVLMMPTKDEKAFREFMGTHFPVEDKDETGLYRFKFRFIFGEQIPAFFRIQNGYAYLTLESATALTDPKKLPAPRDILLKEETSLVAMRWYAEGMPEEIKKRLHELLADAEKNARVGGAELFFMSFVGAKDAKEFFARLNQLVDESKWFSVRLDFERKSGELAFEFNLIPRKETALASEIKEFKPRISRFGALLDKETAIGGIYTLGSFGGFKGELPELTALVRDALQEVDLDGPAERIEELTKSLQHAAQVEGVDFGMALKRAPADKEYYVVGGAHFRKSPELILATIKYMAALPAEKRKRFQPFAVPLTDALKAHKLSLDLPKEFRTTFGETDLYLVARDDAVFFSFGKNAVERLKETLALKPKGGKSLQVELVPENCTALLELPSDKKPAALWNKLFAKKKKINLLSLDLEGGAALKVRYTSDSTEVAKVVSYWRQIENGVAFDLTK
jgi:hypothetical protein